MHKDGGVFSGRGLQAELGVRCLGVVGEGDGAGQLSIVQHLLMVLRQVDVTLRFKLERALQTKKKKDKTKGHMKKKRKKKT